MDKMTGLYCKAYYMRDLRVFGGWTESIPSAADGDASDCTKVRQLQDDDVAFVHDDYSVTIGVFAGVTVINDGKAVGWSKFCTDVLGFAVPPDVIEAGTLASRDLAEMSR